MSWSYVGGVTTGNVSSATTGTISLPAGVNGGDLIVVACCFYNTTFTQSSFTTQQSAHGAQGAKDAFYLGTRIAGGTAGSATTDSTFTITFGATTWGEWVVGVWRATNGVGSIVGSAEYNSASGYQTACPDATYSPSSGNLNIWGYAGQNSSVGTTATSFSGTGPSALTNFIQQGITGNGGGVGMGWKTTTGSPGGATANQAVDPTDFALEAAEAAGTVPAGLAHGTGTAQAPGLAQAALAAGTGTAQPPSAPGPVAAGLARGTGTVTQAALAQAALAAGTGTVTQAALAQAGRATGAGGASSLTAPLAGLATATGTAQPGQFFAQARLATGTGTASQSPSRAGLATGTGTAQAPSAPGPVAAGLAHAAGTAWSTSSPRAGLAHGTSSAGLPVFPAPLSHFAVAFTEPGPSAALSGNNFGGSLAVPNFGAGLAPVTGLGGTLTPVRPSATCIIADYRATLSIAGFGAVITGGTMQQASLTLSEFNDMTINIAVTNNGVAFNLTGYNLNLLLKSAAGVPDSSALVFSSSGGSPAITITSPSAGLAVAQLPNAQLNSEQYTFYRLDVVNASSQQQTTVYGQIIWVTL